jgi:F0F1-type ATP synthase assembly protein I
MNNVAKTILDMIVGLLLVTLIAGNPEWFFIMFLALGIIASYTSK